MKSGWLRRIRSAAAGLALAAGLWTQGAGAAEVKNVTVEYAWPWVAEIRYEVVGTFPTNDPLVVTATDRTKNVSYTSLPSALSGDTGTKAGSHKVLWELDKQGIKIQSTNVVFTVEYRGAYCVVDLSAGANASSYHVTYLNDPPSGGFNKDEYKTTKLVLRRIEAGTFSMGGKFQTTLSKAYYIGLFEVTQKQYQLVTGSNPSPEKFQVNSDKWPVCGVSWITIRGNTNWPTSSAVSANSFMGRLRARTGLEFDLPTEAQWEYACRAGTTSDFNNGGNTTNDLNKVAWWAGNSYGSWGYYSTNHTLIYGWHPTSVGAKQANAWGLYDMHGNVYEWCLDWYGSTLSGGADPKGPSSGTERVQRGGSYGSGVGNSFYPATCRSGCRGADNPTNRFFNTYDGRNGCLDYYGCRLVRTPLPEEGR
ncbi:MAG: formylglycine-generating enzyme family protein [Kiritimatiellae bacterium]|nr:formylglycine-generating enzyme family protein [Kiritimatiellia bacterium]